MRKEFYPTVKDFKNMGLSDYQIKRLIELENIKHYFRHQYKHITHYSAPNSIFFLDIKDTLYHSSGHGDNSVLGRSLDSLQIFMRDILALGALLEQTNGQPLTMDYYHLSEDNGAKIEYKFPIDNENIQYKMDMPFKQISENLTGKVINQSNNEPYKIVFVSTDSIETQKNIILFLFLIYKIYFACTIGIYYHKDNSWIDSQEVLKLEKLFKKCNCDFDTFISNLPPEYSNTFDAHTKNKIENIINNITFLSTKDSNLTKDELMKNFLDRYNIENGLTYDDYYFFACGDSYEQDGPMIKLAFQLGRFGCINNYSFHFFGTSETIRNELLENYNIETRIPIASYGFNDFYNKVMDYISLQRTWDLAETMHGVNNKEKTLVLNRFKKTNHYIQIKK